jgi:hypothetical protein
MQLAALRQAKALSVLIMQIEYSVNIAAEKTKTMNKSSC